MELIVGKNEEIKKMTENVLNVCYRRTLKGGSVIPRPQLSTQF